jgi:ribonuclease HI
MIISPKGLGVLSKVAELIDTSTGTWDAELLRSLFLEVDVKRILEIPINVQGFDDFIAWNYKKNGRYSVKSGYHLQWRHTFGPRANQLALPGTSALNPVWKTVWQLKLPSKIKIFLWRALHGVIPLKSILANRHVGTSGQCPVCLLAAEDVKHLLFQCEMARDLWRTLGLLNVVDEVLQLDNSGSVILELLFRGQDLMMPGFAALGLKEVVAVTCWYLWWIRRRRTHNESVPPLFRCKMSVLAIANAANARGKPILTEYHWETPLARQLKVNVDGSFHLEEREGAAAAVIRDCEGKFIAASSVFLTNISSAATAEAMAMREGLALANRLGCNNIIMESDSKETVDACTGSEIWWGESAAIFADCVDLAALIDKVSFKHCPREANEVAHEIASNSFSSRNSYNWVDEPSDFIICKLLNDVTKR